MWYNAYYFTETVDVNHGNNNAAIYPNPVAENLFIGNMENTGEGMEVFIYNSEGKLIKNKLIQTENNIAVNNLLPGIYFIKIKDQRGAYILKERFIKN